MLKDALPSVKTDLPGEKAKRWLKRCGESLPDAIMSDYPVVIERGEGAVLEDVDGNVFLDWTGGVGVLNIGHCNAEVIAAAEEQMHRYFHSMMSVITHPAYINLIEKLNRIVPVKGGAKKTMLVNCGAEAVENAVKIAKAYTKRPNIIVFSGAYHGRTSLTMAMTAKKSYSFGMGPFPDGVFRVEYPNMYRKPRGMTDAEAVDYYVGKLENIFLEGTPAAYVAAVIIEPVQGEGGFISAPMDWVKAVRKICDEKGILLVVDEVQCGFGRSGKFFVSDYWKEAGCAPDILACAKSIAGGLPLGAVTASSEVMDSVPHGVIGGTFCGNAVACAAALKVIEIMERDHLAGRALTLSERLSESLRKIQGRFEQIGDVRGRGSMIGVEFITDEASKKPDAELVGRIIGKSLSKGLVVMRAGLYGNIIRFLYPLTITDEQFDAGIGILEQAIAESISEGC